MLYPYRTNVRLMKLCLEKLSTHCSVNEIFQSCLYISVPLRMHKNTPTTRVIKEIFVLLYTYFSNYSNPHAPAYFVSFLA